MLKTSNPQNIKIPKCSKEQNLNIIKFSKPENPENPQNTLNPQKFQNSPILRIPNPQLKIHF